MNHTGPMKDELNELQMELDADRRFQYEEYDEEPDFDAELIEAGWNIVRENPGIEVEEWTSELIRQYPTEVVDALGVDPFDVFDTLRDWWDSKECTDPEIGDWNTLAGWSEYYATDPEYLQLRLEKADNRIKELENELTLCKAKIDRLEDRFGTAKTSDCEQLK